MTMGCGDPLALLPGQMNLPMTIESIPTDAAGQGSTVILRGTVGDRSPLLGAQVYQLQDRTGDIWVLSSDETIQTGEQLKIRGRVEHQSVSAVDGDQTQVYIQELEQLERSPQ
ncbi:MAG: hypothetical protein EA367_10260 [Leptolyngbya sp. DLM2.Bin15]|nr:MAG: hypothetical protein EA367_10260 [Leptolyngbya sp. DLM2.Bin15]